MKQGKTRILIADDHALMRVGIRSMLESTGDFTVIGECCDGESAVAMALKAKPDVVIMDLMMPDMDGTEATRQLLQRQPEAKVLIFTTFGTADGIGHALAAGASGAILKNVELPELVAAIKTVVSGGRALSPEIEQILADDPPLPELSARQTEILHSIIRGLSNEDIARQLGISLPMVKEHVNATFAKLGAANRAEAVGIALRKHLLKL